MVVRPRDHKIGAVKPITDKGAVGFDFPDASGAANETKAGFFSAASLAGKPVPPRGWLVEGLIPQNNVTLFSGDGGTGKSLAALMAAVAVVRGDSWLGRPMAKGCALYLSAEDDNDELHRRLDDILRGTGGGFDELAALTLVSLAAEDTLLALDTQHGLIPSPLFRDVEAWVAENRPVLVVIDTLADVFPANENDRAKARQFVQILRGLAVRYACAVLVLSHPSLHGLTSGSGTSGSTGWSNSVRSRLYLERVKKNEEEPDPNRRILRLMKSNYSRTGVEIPLTWKDGTFVAGATPAILDKDTQTAKAESVFLDLLRQTTAQGRRVNHAGSKTYAPTLFAELPGSKGVTKAMFRRVMETMLADGRIIIKTVGPPSRRVSFLVEATE